MNDEITRYRSKPTQRKAGRPRRDAGDSDVATQTQILDQAKRLFRQSGFAAISISAIVEAVGITKPTLYYYFADKESLYAAVLCEALSNANRYIVAGMAGRATCREKLYSLSKGFFRNCPTSVAMLMRDAMENLAGENLEKVTRTMDGMIVAPFIQMLEEAIASGEIKPVDTRVMAHLIIGMLDSLVTTFTMHYSREFDYDGMASTLIDSFMDGITVK